MNKLIIKIFGYKFTWKGYLNFLLLQWLFIRILQWEDEDGTKGLGLLVGVIPLTGWWSDYLVAPKPYIKLSTYKPNYTNEEINNVH